MAYSHWRLLAFVLGVVCGGLGCYGACEFTYSLESKVTYLVIAAPVVAAAAAVIPPLAEASWRRGFYLKTIGWWLVLLPAAATVFFAAAERVHVAKSGAEAERAARRSAVARAYDGLALAKAAARQADRDEVTVRGVKHCGPRCQGIKETAAVARQRAVEAEERVLDAESRAKAESPLKAPVWLLPTSLDLVTFMSIWFALSSPKRSRRAVKAKKRRARKSKTVTPNRGSRVVTLPIRRD